MTYERFIAAKRDALEHTEQEIDEIVSRFTAGMMPDYQMAAWLMAVQLNGMTDAETTALTAAMVRSGRVIDLSGVDGAAVDKHSTGGVADTTTLVLAPLVAACGAPVAKMSGRGLAHTGGTLDKLESIPGMNVSLSELDFVAQVKQIGVAVMAQSDEVVPADKRMYALRDVTATVPSVPLIVSSIVSKKIAGGADAILLDVKVGSGAFMRTRRSAGELARSLERTCEDLGRSARTIMTSMDQPLGSAVGNALEVAEAIRVLQGRGSSDLREVCLSLAGAMVHLGGRADTAQDGRGLAERALCAGDGARMMERWIEAQGGDPRVVENLGLLPTARVTREVLSPRAGYVTAVDAHSIGLAAMHAGAGRQRPGDAVDPSAGVELHARVGDAIGSGFVLARVHSSSEGRAEASARAVASAFAVSDERTPPPLLFIEG